ncbi:MAG: transposase [Acidobacteriota bacterium]
MARAICRAAKSTQTEVLQRQAYGFRNFNNYRLRVKIMCS